MSYQKPLVTLIFVLDTILYNRNWEHKPSLIYFMKSQVKPLPSVTRFFFFLPSVEARAEMLCFGQPVLWKNYIINHD